MKISIYKLAVKEFDEAIEWYELQQKGLGERFKKIVINKLEQIKKNTKWFYTENIYIGSQ